MSSDSLALKYRPKKISDLIGQEQATRVLTNLISNAVKTGELNHAYLFAGKFGCGKTSAARIFAASVNNPSGISLEPDLSQPIVQSIYEGRHIDILEQDAAALGKVDEIRAIRENIRFSPLEARYRFVILDEAHRLTDAAAEAALKMIEEPPANTIFILATTDPDKIKDTIHSRCMSVNFRSIPWEIIYQHLRKVADLEKIECDDTALKIAAKRAKGSMRSSLQNLQKLSMYAGGKKITEQTAAECLQSVSESQYFDLVDSILKSDIAQAMRSIDLMLGDGREVGDVLEGLVDHLRNLLIISSCRSTSGLLVLSEDEKKKYVSQIGRFPEGTKGVQVIAEMIDLLANVRKAIFLNMNPQTMLESFVIKTIIFQAALKRAEA